MNVSQPEQKTWTVPPPPPLYKAPRRDKPTKRVPLMIFGWPVTYDDQVVWADKLDITRDLTESNRAHLALREVMERLPPKARGPAIVNYKDGIGTCALCIYIGSNVSQEQITLAQNEDLISEVWRRIALGREPRWLRRID